MDRKTNSAFLNGTKAKGNQTFVCVGKINERVATFEPEGSSCSAARGGFGTSVHIYDAKF
jgi:hypothetical protein